MKKPHFRGMLTISLWVRGLFKLKLSAEGEVSGRSPAFPAKDLDEALDEPLVGDLQTDEGGPKV